MSRWIDERVKEDKRGSSLCYQIPRDSQKTWPLSFPENGGCEYPRSGETVAQRHAPDTAGFGEI